MCSFSHSLVSLSHRHAGLSSVPLISNTCRPLPRSPHRLAFSSSPSLHTLASEAFRTPVQTESSHRGCRIDRRASIPRVRCEGMRWFIKRGTVQGRGGLAHSSTREHRSCMQSDIRINAHTQAPKKLISQSGGSGSGRLVEWLCKRSKWGLLDKCTCERVQGCTAGISIFIWIRDSTLILYVKWHSGAGCSVLVKAQVAHYLEGCIWFVSEEHAENAMTQSIVDLLYS